MVANICSIPGGSHFDTFAQMCSIIQKVAIICSKAQIQGTAGTQGPINEGLVKPCKNNLYLCNSLRLQTCVYEKILLGMTLGPLHWLGSRAHSASEDSKDICHALSQIPSMVG